MTDKEILEAMSSLLKPIQTQLNTMQDSINVLKTDMAHHNHTVEPMIKAIKDGVEGLQDRYKQVDRLEVKVSDHSDRIFALEQAYQKAN